MSRARLLPGGAGDAPPPHHLRLARAAALGVLLSAFAGAAGAGAPALPDGFGPIRFGMSVEEVRKLRPALAPRQTAGAAPAPASAVGSPLALESFELADEAVLGLRPCRVGLRFANDRLYQLDFRCDRPGGEVKRALLAAFGPARSAVGSYVHWLTRSRAVTVDPRTFRFSFTDRSTDERVQRFLLARALEAGLHPVESEGRSPAAGRAPPPAAGIAEPDGREPKEGAAPTAAGPVSPGPGRISPLPDRSWFVDPERTAGLLVRLHSDAPRDEKLAILAELSAVGAEGTAEGIAPLLRAEDELLFEGAVQALEDLATPAAVAVLGDALARRELVSARRLRVVEALGWLGRRLDATGALAAWARGAGFTVGVDPVALDEAVVFLEAALGRELARGAARTPSASS